MRYALLNDALMILGTQGREEAIYRHELKALPVPPLPWMSMCDDGELDLLVTDYPFNFALDTALFHIRDPGILGDVYQFCQAYPCLMALKREGESLRNTLATLQKEQATHLERVQAHIKEVEEVKAQLVAARVCSHIEPVMAHLAVDGIIPNAMFNQYFRPIGTGHPNEPPRRAHLIINPSTPPVIP